MLEDIETNGQGAASSVLSQLSNFTGLSDNEKRQQEQTLWSSNSFTQILGVIHYQIQPDLAKATNGKFS